MTVIYWTCFHQEGQIMPVTTQWDNPEQTVVYQQYSGHWGVAEVHQALDQLKALTNPQGPVTLLVDISTAQNMPSNLLSAAGRMNTIFKERVKAIVVIGANRYIVTVARLFIVAMPWLGASMKFANTVEEARSVLSVKQPS
jgi:hypothetical protein